MLFHKRTQKALKVVWWIVAILVIVSMILLYTPIFSSPASAPSPQPATTETVS